MRTEQINSVNGMQTNKYCPLDHGPLVMYTTDFYCINCVNTNIKVHCLKTLTYIHKVIFSHSAFHCMGST